MTACHEPITGLTPQRYVKGFYENSLDASRKSIRNRKRSCHGNPILLVDEKGKKIKMSCYRCGGRSISSVYCTICHHTYCFGKNKPPLKLNLIGAIDTKKKDKNNKKIFKYCIMTCFHLEHPAAFPLTTDSEDTDALPNVTPDSNRTVRRTL